MEPEAHELLMRLIFAPKEVWLPERLEEALISLNIWPKYVKFRSQKEALLAQPSFDIGGTTYYTKAPELKVVPRDK